MGKPLHSLTTRGAKSVQYIKIKTILGLVQTILSSLVLSIFFGCLGVAGCSTGPNEETPCVLGTSLLCRCETAARDGERLCQSDGTYSPCVCPQINCFDSCDAKFPGGVEDLARALDCVNCVACGQSCHCSGSTGICNGGTCDACTTSACAANACSGVITACSNDSSCVSLNECYAKCTGGGGLSSSGSSSSSSSGDIVTIWAGWRMPNPPSTGLPNPANYTVDSLNDVVTDHVTGLMWQRTMSANLTTWESAKASCESLVLGTYTDWRAPTRIELISLVDFTRTKPAIDPNAFPNTPVAVFWTSSRVADDSEGAWIVNFDDGSTFRSIVTALHPVRCVR